MFARGPRQKFPSPGNFAETTLSTYRLMMCAVSLVSCVLYKTCVGPPRAPRQRGLLTVRLYPDAPAAPALSPLSCLVSLQRAAPAAPTRLRPTLPWTLRIRSLASLSLSERLPLSLVSSLYRVSDTNSTEHCRRLSIPNVYILTPVRPRVSKRITRCYPTI